MRNSGQEVCAKHIEKEVRQKEWESNYQDYAVSKFEQIYRQNRIKCGLEVSRA